MNVNEFDPEAWLDATAPALGLVIEPEWRPQVLLYLKITANAASQFVDWPFDPIQDEIAPVFRL